MELTIIGLAAFLASLLTFFSGFGLGTVLLAVSSLFFPVEAALSLTAIVHFLNNGFKLSLLHQYVSRRVVLLFGLPALLAAFAGALLLGQLSEGEALYRYTLFGKMVETGWAELIIGLSLVFFALADSLPFWQKMKVSKRHWIGGGLLSGFSGGISGQQGALRSLFLVHAGLGKEGYVATGTVVALLVDVARIPVYFAEGIALGQQEYTALLVAVAAALAGALLGRYTLKKISITFLHRFVLGVLVVLGLGIAAGIIGS